MFNALVDPCVSPGKLDPVEPEFVARVALSGIAGAGAACTFRFRYKAKLCPNSSRGKSRGFIPSDSIFTFQLSRFLFAPSRTEVPTSRFLYTSLRSCWWNGCCFRILVPVFAHFANRLLIMECFEDILIFLNFPVTPMLEIVFVQAIGFFRGPREVLSCFSKTIIVPVFAHSQNRR